MVGRRGVRVAAAVVAGVLVSGVLAAPPAGADPGVSRVSTFDELVHAFYIGGAVQLAASITAPAGGYIVAESDRPVTLDLNGEQLTISNPADGQAAVRVERAASLTIADTTGAGTLTATGGSLAAGIGGASAGNGGSVTVTGGSVNATGSEWGAGIGGGWGGFGGPVTVTGGSVNATGVLGGAGIGGGYGWSGASVTVTGGSVTATGGYFGAGIGGGYQGGSGPVTVSGGSVTATGGYFAAGVGGGYEGFDSGVVVGPAGTLTAADGGNGSAIGAGPGGLGRFRYVQNAGVLNIPTGATWNVDRAMAVYNSGTVNVAGTLMGGQNGVGVVYSSRTANANIYPGAPNQYGRILPTDGGRIAGNGQGTPGLAFAVTDNNYTLVFDANGSSDANPASEQVYAATVADSNQELPAGPTRPSGSGPFMGWFTERVGGVQIRDTTELPTVFGPGARTETLYAHYAALSAQTVRFTSRAPSPATAGSTYRATATGGGSGNPILFSIDPSTEDGVCTVGSSSTTNRVSAATVSFTGAGACVIAATQPGTGRYAEGRATQTVNVIPRRLPPIGGRCPLTSQGRPTRSCHRG